MYILLTTLVVLCCYLLWKVSELKSKPATDSESASQLEEAVKAESTFAKHELYDDYFVSNEVKLIFSLLYTEGETRTEILGITEDMYESIALAKAWKSAIIKQIHPDKCKHPKASEAASKVNAIYTRMKKYGK